VKRIIIIVIFLFFFLTKSAQTLQLRNHGDKILHFTGSYFIAYTTYHYLQPKIGHKKAKTYSIATSIGIGILKEIIDERYRKGGEVEDMYANVGGVVLFRFDLTR
jgi:hypothetical protein